MSEFDFNWNIWLPFFILLFSWIGTLWFADKKKDAVFAVAAFVLSLGLLLSVKMQEIYVAGTVPLTALFVFLSAYEIFIILTKR
jgi:hypothetical protein